MIKALLPIWTTSTDHLQVAWHGRLQ